MPRKPLATRTRITNLQSQDLQPRKKQKILNGAFVPTVPFHESDKENDFVRRILA
jgi:hypothetical protein